MGLRLGQDFTMPPSKLEPFPRGQRTQKARCGTRPGVGCPCPGLSSSSPHSTTMKEAPPSLSPLPGALLPQLMTPSLQWLQREREALGSAHPVTAGPRDLELLHSGYCRIQKDMPTSVPGSLCRGGGWVSLHGKFCTAEFSLVSNFHLKRG